MFQRLLGNPSDSWWGGRFGRGVGEARDWRGNRGSTPPSSKDVETLSQEGEELKAAALLWGEWF